MSQAPKSQNGAQLPESPNQVTTQSDELERCFELLQLIHQQLSQIEPSSENGAPRAATTELSIADFPTGLLDRIRRQARRRRRTVREEVIAAVEARLDRLELAERMNSTEPPEPPLTPSDFVSYHRDLLD